MQQLAFEYHIPNGICKECLKSPVFIKKRSLCKQCYRKWYGKLHSTIIADRAKKRYTPKPPHSSLWYRKRMVEKYGSDIIPDLKALKNRQFWTLAEVGNKYGFSREYARQLFKTIFGKSYGKYEKEKAAKRQAEIEMLKCSNDPRHKMANYNPGLQRDGAKAELMVFNKCKELGLNAEIPCKMVFDLKINGFQVDVKSTTKEVSTSKVPGATTYFHFGISRKQHDVCDFFICYAFPINAYYIIPNEATPGKRSIYIKATASKLGAQYIRGPGKYAQYKEAWHLLEA